MEVIQQDNIIVKRFINPFKKSNSFLIECLDAEGAWLFDIGNSEELLRITESLKVNGLFLTHSHFDHIFNIKVFQDKHPECKIYGSKRCIEWLRDDRRNLSLYYEKPLNLNPENCVPVTDSEDIRLTDTVTVQIYQTPGHAEDCLTYKINSFLITGDSYIPNVPPVTKLRGGNKDKYTLSLNLIRLLMDIDTILLPGHGPIYSNTDIID